MELAHTNALSLQAPASMMAQVEPCLVNGTDVSKTQASPCTRCGGKGHSLSGCWAREVACHWCKKRGHLSHACRSTRGRPTRYSRPSYQIEAESEGEDLISTVYTVKTACTIDPYKVTLDMNGKPLCMEIDTGTAVSLISERTKKALFPRVKLYKPKLKLHTYTAQPISVVGEMLVTVKHPGCKGKLIPYIVIERKRTYTVGQELVGARETGLGWHQDGMFIAEKIVKQTFCCFPGHSRHDD